MKLDVGPVAPSSASAWIEWARDGLGPPGDEPATATCPSPQMLADVNDYLHRWDFRTSDDEPFHWHVEVDADELEFVTTALFHLDPHLPSVPPEGRVFHLVLVQALLRALELDSPTRAAFADQMRWSWPTATAAL